VNKGHLVPTFLRSFSLSLVKYNFWGDQNWRHNYPPHPNLDPLMGATFLFGFIFSFYRAAKLLAVRLKEKIRKPELDSYLLLIALFFSMLVPEFMTAEGLPHGLRSIGTIPAVFIFSALAFEYIFHYVEKARIATDKKKLLLSALTVLLVAIGFFNAIKYHIFWAKEPKVATSFNKNLTMISHFVKTIPSEREKYVITSFNTLDRLPIFVFNKDLPNISYVYPNELWKVNPKDPKNMTVILVEKNADAIRELQNKFPDLKIREVADNPGSVYFVME
jgi:hypothetical protein